MSQNNTAAVYKWVIEDVMDKMSNQFLTMGLDHLVLTQLQQIWEQKLAASQVTAPAVPQPFQHHDEDFGISASASSSSRRKKSPPAPPTRNDDDDDDDDDDNDDSDGVLGSDLDDSDQAEDEDENDQTDNLILCQYEKVTRIKNKWKCVLKDGIINVNGRDHLFSKLSGDFDW